ncbi:hypothetical protein HNQ96_002545 [Aminobacter lissarensis]|uniref:Uncharacterized protein n=1 Tax=Aminobacter carboxidus TaxID=376165 RepID=A0A8E1WDC6_9HYPH|nr:hypothetical protein [Aminobacter lissarensis]MBB6466680.1 hypothetical protein [Aminobacter lissarensis]
MIERWFGVDAVKMSSTPPPPNRDTPELHPAAMPATSRTAPPRARERLFAFKILKRIALTRALPDTN